MALFHVHLVHRRVGTSRARDERHEALLQTLQRVGVELVLVGLEVAELGEGFARAGVEVALVGRLGRG